MKRPTSKSSVLSPATVVAALISGTAAVLTAVLPWLLKSHEQSSAARTGPAETLAAAGGARPDQVAAPDESITPIGSSPAVPNLTFGAWSIIDSIDEAGIDYTGSTLKFISQRESAGGLEATGFFEWRSGAQVLGREYVVANFDAASRQLFIEGKSVESSTGTLALGSFSARVSEDGRQLLNGTWGNTPGNPSGYLGKWQARR
jgi:hypothetical protein